MVYTVTFSPSLDYYMKLEDFNSGGINRASEIRYRVGGKGINVSRILGALGTKSLALGFVSGFTGNEIERRLNEESISNKFIDVSYGISRINVKLIGKEETEVNAPAEIPNGDVYIKELSTLLNSVCENDYVVFAGTIPSNISDKAISFIFPRILERGASIVVDTSGNALEMSLTYKPYLIKPNLTEAAGMLGVKKKSFSFDYVCDMGKELCRLGAKNVLISCGADGAVLLCDDEQVFTCIAPQGDVYCTVGCGDAMLAGYIHAVINGNKGQEAICFSVACGSAVAFSRESPNMSDIIYLYKHLIQKYID